MSRMWRCGLVAVVALGTGGGLGLAAGTQQEGLTLEQTKVLLNKAMERRPFSKAPRAAQAPETLGRFFRSKDYDEIRGNPILGYWDLGTFRWEGESVAWDGIKGVTRETSVISEEAWRKAFDLVLAKHRLRRDDRAAVRVRGACVAAKITGSAQDPGTGVEVELELSSPSGVLRYRLVMGKPTIGETLGASLDWVVSFARTERGS
jgi:hypothetical protein